MWGGVYTLCFVTASGRYHLLEATGRPLGWNFKWSGARVESARVRFVGSDDMGFSLSLAATRPGVYLLTIRTGLEAHDPVGFIAMDGDCRDTQDHLSGQTSKDTRRPLGLPAAGGNFFPALGRVSQCAARHREGPLAIVIELDIQSPFSMTWCR
jgi:hypothetical protein